MKKIKDVMTDRPLVINSNATVLEALKLMSSAGDIRHLPVMEGSQLVGIVTSRDLKSYVGHWSSMSIDGLLKKERLDRPISRLMTRNVTTVSPEDPVVKAAKLFASKKIGALPVIEDGKLVGIISYVDLLSRFIVPSILETQEKNPDNE